MYLSANSANNDDSILLWYDGTQFSAWCRKDGEGPYYTVSGAPSTGVWYHVAMTCASGGNFTTYLNGEIYALASAPNLAGRPNLDYHHLGFGGDVIMQDCMVFADALSQTEIRHVQTTLTAPTRIAPYAWYRLRNDAPLADATGNGHTLAGGAGSIANGANILMAGAASVVTSGAGSIGSGYAATATGLSTVSGSVVDGASKAVTATGTVGAAGSADVSVTKPLTATGQAQTSGTAGVAYLIDGTGNVVTSGAASIGVSRPVALEGSTSTSGSSALVVVRPISVLGRSRTEGRVSFVGQHNGGQVIRTQFSRRAATGMTGRRAVRR
jgi:hypothetical protein